jgi:hypothetical protein
MSLLTKEEAEKKGNLFDHEYMFTFQTFASKYLVNM